MTNIEIVKAWNEALFSDDPASSNDFLTDDFQFTGPVPVPLSKEAYFGFMLILIQAFSDLKNHLNMTGETADTATGSVQMAGTHDGDLDLSVMGGPVVPPTGKSFLNPQESITCTIRDGKISIFAVEVPADGGVAGMLAQLGVQMG